MKMHTTQEILNMICDRNLVENLRREAKSRARTLESIVYVYYRPEWCNATVTTEYKGKENLFFKVEKPIDKLPQMC